MNTPKAIIKDFIDATNARNWDKFDRLVDDNFIRHSSAVGEDINSKEKLRKFHQKELTTFPDLKETILFMIEEDDYVAARINFKGTQTGHLGPFQPSGKTLNADFNCIFKIKQGKIKESWVEYDRLDSLIQLGHYKLPNDF